MIIEIYTIINERKKILGNQIWKFNIKERLCKKEKTDILKKTTTIHFKTYIFQFILG